MCDVKNGDPVVENLIEKFKARSLVGIKKYGTTLEDNELSLEQWLIHAQEEAMDCALYLNKIILTLREKKLKLVK